jgi:5,6-dimethylbenzimidazole synthase
MTDIAKEPIEFTSAERDAFYKVLFSRRDVRGQFKPDPVCPDMLRRILTAAHHAPSVGFMQPWNFIVVDDPAVKQRVHEDFTAANAEAAAMFESDRATLYRKFKLEGIREAPINICVTCDRARTGPVVIGRTQNPEMDLYSSVCAVQNLWLAARAEGLGVGWVSILHEGKLRAILGIPENIVPIAYLCVGHVEFFHREPELATAGWQQRLPIDELIFNNQWGTTA